MSKEKVVVFNGEDKFIAPRNTIYDKNAGESQLVGDETPSSVRIENNPDKQVFDDYMTRKSTPVIMPSPVEPNFCARMEQFISSRGNGMASPEMQMEAYRLFQDNCVEKPDVASPITNIPDQPPVKTVVAEVPKEAEVPPASSPLPFSFSPLSSPNLGRPPSSGGSGGGGNEEEKGEPEKKVNWLLWAVIGGSLLYFITRKKD